MKENIKKILILGILILAIISIIFWKYKIENKNILYKGDLFHVTPDEGYQMHIHHRFNLNI